MVDKVYRAKISVMPAANNLVCTLQSIINQMKTDGDSFKRCEIDNDDWFSFVLSDEESVETVAVPPLVVNEKSLQVTFSPRMPGKEVKAKIAELIRTLQRFKSSDWKTANINTMVIQNNEINVEFEHPQVSKEKINTPAKVGGSNEHKPTPDSKNGSQDNEKERLLLIDGSNLLSRSYYGTAYGQDESALMKTSTGIFTNAVKAFIEKLFALVKTYKPSHVGICWDVKRDETFRRLLNPEYKATRTPTPDALVQQFDTVKDLLKEMGVACWMTPLFEADDLLGTLAKRWSKERNAQCLIYSHDRDLFQVIDSNISQILTKSGEEIVYGLQDFQEDHYNISPEQFIDVKAILGDKGDNIIGIPGVGEKAALPLIVHYGSLEGIYDHLVELDPKFKRYQKKLEAGKESGMLSKHLATIVTEVPDMYQVEYDQMLWHIDKQGFETGLERLELKSILRRVDSLVG
ncbi:5'-3' exonuclease H3TH domain-containing protein [Brevibacillus sp. NPDC003359]|uniref:5'-3' exonuclease n=1 Tax=unclassified Brevibacillus TaxID=2684853 RepID=UPI0036743655